MNNYLHRIYRNLFSGPLEARRIFTETVMRDLESTIEQTEKRHSAQVKLVIDGGLSLPELVRGLPPREKALELFSQLKIWDTEANNGVLLYLSVADHAIEIISDRGICSRLSGSTPWREICDEMVAAFRRDEFKEGIALGIERITTILAEHFPPKEDQKNELSDAPLRI